MNTTIVSRNEVAILVLTNDEAHTLHQLIRAELEDPRILTVYDRIESIQRKLSQELNNQ